MAKYEYEFVRMGEGFLGARSEAERDDRNTITEHARQGWRLVQIFAPGMGAYGQAKYSELILEREI